MNVELGFAAIAALMVLLALRMPIGLALAAVALGGLYLTRGLNPALGAARAVPFEFIAHWTLSAVPMFILMGAIASHGGIIGALYSSLRLWLGRLPGGLAIATSFAGAGFAAISGSSLATTAALGRIAVPEMLAAGYNKGLATGTASAVGTIGALIPPSIIMVIYANFAEVSAGRMLIAGLIPGLITAGMYALLVYIRCSLDPHLAPVIDLSSVTFSERVRSLGPVWPVPLIAFGIVGIIYGGLATATEAAAVGVILTMLVVASQRRLTKGGLFGSLVETVTTTSSIFLIAIGAALMTQFLAFTGMPAYLSNLVSTVTDSHVGIMIIFCIVYLVLGSFLDPLGVMLLTLPIILPVLGHMGIDPIWSGVILVKMLEIGLLTPPVGLNCFVMKSAVGDRVSLGEIFRGTSWFLLAEIVIMALLLGFPSLITWLPSLMVND